MIYIECKKKIKCKTCKGAGFVLVEDYEYVCNDCRGLKYKIKSVLVDIETLAEKVGEKIKCQ